MLRTPLLVWQKIPSITFDFFVVRLATISLKTIFISMLWTRQLRLRCILSLYLIFLVIGSICSIPITPITPIAPITPITPTISSLQKLQITIAYIRFFT
jgi:hypothetical protein